MEKDQDRDTNLVAEMYLCMVTDVKKAIVTVIATVFLPSFWNELFGILPRHVGGTTTDTDSDLRSAYRGHTRKEYGWQ